LGTRAGAVVAAVGKGEEVVAGDEPSPVQAVRGPLGLSFTQINDFERCPGCWYVKHRLKLEGTPSDEINLGVVVHDALCDFYGEWAAADAESRPLPTTARLLEIGRQKYLGASEGQVDKQVLERIGEMLKTAHEKMHGRDGRPVQIIERPELEVQLKIKSDKPGGDHTVFAKIDRLEQLPAPESGVRIVDYKTGQDWKKYREPGNDDLQMGIYALALDQLMGGGEPIEGVAEYWLLATGDVGVLPLAELKREKVLKRIETAIAGMLSGDYPTGKDCREGLCRLLRPGLVVDP
jgi:RecB family exonuclease